MPDNNQSNLRKLFADDMLSVFAILDGASVPDLLARLDQHKPDYVCLYRGVLEPDIASVAPYLVHLQVDAELTNWIVSEGWGKHWGIFALSSSDLHGLRQHFRRLLTVYDPNNKPVLFRFYDPRVLRKYLPTCNVGELESMFGPTRSFIVEDEDGKGAFHFHVASGSLKCDKV